jgi:hypothetical protein
MAAAMVRAGPTHLSDRCGIADELRTDVEHLYRKSLSALADGDDPTLIDKIELAVAW